MCPLDPNFPVFFLSESSQFKGYFHGEKRNQNIFFHSEGTVIPKRIVLVKMSRTPLTSKGCLAFPSFRLSVHFTLSGEHVNMSIVHTLMTINLRKRRHYSRVCRLTFVARDWLKTCHDNATLKCFQIPHVRFKFQDF